ncbi:2-polyprenyl-6-methoxyphenol hydroxylase-like FAD-dependent oxidoreductase [Pedobacter cryoconitis]|uniref:2-polyprenyl-6-methoxyphenol hydroxylase-like FAD-dependent oxidoreductase n=1 Tax=Pedobacter cryoconitis TaxID=188932 RepID=A0A7W8ZN52_9SPHI|nr:FAD-dependent monooxygenase [Pedobacter cryoconitis]MBB5636812.1 2-polyprenyl-6-methoxyphenol hydroxylase-like FAD-dependent oxidoreductase [Pedobacter cryoconitis]
MESIKKHILISGAGIAGLSTAYWLIKYGFNVTIAERAEHIRPGGQALDIRGPALQVAAQMGILELIRNNSTKLKGMSVIDATSGEEIFSSTERTMTGGKLDSPDLEILRDDLCRILFQTVNNQAEYIFNDTIISIHQNETGVDVTFLHAAPQHFDLVIGADGLRSNVRRLVFGPDKQFMRYLGNYVATFTMPNFLNLDHWEVFFQHEGIPVAVSIVKEKDSEARTYLGFSADEPLDYDYHDIKTQKALLTERVPNVGNNLPKILEHMQTSSNFYFDSMNQIIMDNWSKDRVVLVGDAGYSVSPATGQGTTIAMVGAYVLAGELSTNKHDLLMGLNNYENELRGYVKTNQELACDSGTDEHQSFGSFTDENSVPDFGLSMIPFKLKTYH